jgi:hypothetical protein
MKKNFKYILLGAISGVVIMIIAWVTWAFRNPSSIAAPQARTIADGIALRECFKEKANLDCKKIEIGEATWEDAGLFEGGYWSVLASTGGDEPSFNLFIELGADGSLIKASRAKIEKIE